MAQVNPTVGDFEGNRRLVCEYIERAREAGANIVVFPELVVSGYPPQDLLNSRAFLEDNQSSLELVRDSVQGIVAVVGSVEYDSDWRLYNSAAVIQDGRILAMVRKTLLPTYDVFDEERYFEANSPDDIEPVEVMFDNIVYRLGVEICEDLWDDDYSIKVTDILVEHGAHVIVNISSSPFHVGKRMERFKLMQDRAMRLRVPILLTNLVGGQDELVFDGHSQAVDASGVLVSLAKQFEEDLSIFDLNLRTGLAEPIPEPVYDKDAEIFNALVLGIRDYFRKTGFKMAVLGLSGGIDSAVTACIAAEALGPENIIGASMPSKYSSLHSKTDAQQLAENLGMHYIEFSIQDIVDSYHAELAAPLTTIRDEFGLTPEDDDPVADENIQPRVRGNCLMDFSNRLKHLKILVLNTGNKTELALGYCTLYGDLTGGVGVIGDVNKLQVYNLARYYNRLRESDVIPQSTIEKIPSAELKEGQYDPFDFDIVSPMVDEIVENRRSRRELIDMGYSEDVVEDVYSRFINAEYKRWQAPPCIRITRKAFGTGWKMPIVNHYLG
jgi:NAD+ synthase (glutamine-hydrolysing)